MYDPFPLTLNTPQKPGFCLGYNWILWDFDGYKNICHDPLKKNRK
jgi:hypothetical protein